MIIQLGYPASDFLPPKTPKHQEFTKLCLGFFVAFFKYFEKAS